MKEWIYRRGEEYQWVDNSFEIPFWKRLLFMFWWDYSYLYTSKENTKPFIDLINSEGKIRRVYVQL